MGEGGALPPLASLVPLDHFGRNKLEIIHITLKYRKPMSKWKTTITNVFYSYKL